jgi:hypothetical protein
MQSRTDYTCKRNRESESITTLRDESRVWRYPPTHYVIMHSQPCQETMPFVIIVTQLVCVIKKRFFLASFVFGKTSYCIRIKFETYKRIYITFCLFINALNSQDYT